MYLETKAGGCSTKHVLLTYNGPWGLLEGEVVDKMVFQAKSLHDIPALQIDMLVDSLRLNSKALHIWRELQRLVVRLMEREDVADLGYSLEVCTKTFL